MTSRSLVLYNAATITYFNGTMSWLLSFAMNPWRLSNKVGQTFWHLDVRRQPAITMGCGVGITSQLWVRADRRYPSSASCIVYGLPTPFVRMKLIKKNDVLGPVRCKSGRFGIKTWQCEFYLQQNRGNPSRKDRSSSIPRSILFVPVNW